MEQGRRRTSRSRGRGSGSSFSGSAPIYAIIIPVAVGVFIIGIIALVCWRKRRQAQIDAAANVQDAQTPAPNGGTYVYDANASGGGVPQQITVGQPMMVPMHPVAVQVGYDGQPITQQPVYGIPAPGGGVAVGAYDYSATNTATGGYPANVLPAPIGYVGTTPVTQPLFQPSMYTYQTNNAPMMPPPPPPTNSSPIMKL